MISPPLVRYVLTAAARDRLVITLLLMIALFSATGVFLGSAAVVEQGQFSVVFGAGGLRFLGVMGVILFVCFHMRRAFEHKEVEFLLSRPISRAKFLFSHAAAFVLFAILAALAVTAPLLFAGAPHPSGLAAWGYSIAVEYAVMAVSALFFSMVLSSAAGSALAVFGFYALCRLIGTLIGIAATPPENLAFAALHRAMDVISIVVPRLDLMGQTSWLVYGVEGSDGMSLLARAGPHARSAAEAMGLMGFITAQGAVFTALLLAASAFDFSRRRF
jgi:ABC-type transport system involved in multi-copper enzyme maturation permease subunit